LKKLINRFFKPVIAPIPFIPANTRVYCIGDIHGRNDLLQQLLAKIAQDRLQFEGRVLMIYLGDFIDRGLHSKQVINTLLNNQKATVEIVYLRGNHEQTLLDCLQNAALIPTWLTFGGQTTLFSYDVAITKIPTKPQDLLEIQKQLQAKLPPSHYTFFVNTRLSYSLGSYFFVHAGISPKRPIAKQWPEDMLWIREEFTECTKNYPQIIVHGHSISEQPQLLGNRIGIDTGAYASGVLTCLVLEADRQRILQTGLV
jgi:serine/threonine protein phosphatase 1